MTTTDMISESFENYTHVHTPKQRTNKVNTRGYTVQPTTDMSYYAQLQRAHKRHVTNDIYAVTLHKQQSHVTIYDILRELEPKGITNVQYIDQDHSNIYLLVKLPKESEN